MTTKTMQQREAEITDELANATMSAHLVAAATGVQRATLQQWCNAEVVGFTQVKAGGRTFRRFSVLDALTVALVEIISRIGIKPMEAKEIVELAREGIGQRIIFMGVDNPVTYRFFAIFHGGNELEAMFFHPNDPISQLVQPGTSNAGAFIVVDIDSMAKKTIDKLAKQKMAEEDSE